MNKWINRKLNKSPRFVSLDIITVNVSLLTSSVRRRRVSYVADLPRGERELADTLLCFHRLTYQRLILGRSEIGQALRVRPPELWSSVTLIDNSRRPDHEWTYLPHHDLSPVSPPHEWNSDPESYLESSMYMFSYYGMTIYRGHDYLSRDRKMRGEYASQGWRWRESDGYGNRS